MEYKQRATEDWDEAVNLLTGPAEISIPSTWGTSGRIFIRQDDPIPSAILSIVPSGAVGG
jgi:hypothetical protein